MFLGQLYILAAAQCRGKRLSLQVLAWPLFPRPRFFPPPLAILSELSAL